MSAEHNIRTEGPLELDVANPADVHPPYVGAVLFYDSTNSNRLSIMRSDATVAEVLCTPIIISSVAFNGTQNASFGMPATTGITGKTLTIKGQDTDVGHIGGQLKLQSGRGYDSNGVVFAEGDGNADFFQAFSEGGASPQVAIVGNGSGTPILKFLQGDGVITGLGYLDATQSYMFGRVSSGTIVYRLGVAGMRLSTDAGVPVEKLEVDGKIQLKAVAAPGGSPPAGNFWIYMDVADSTLKCKGPSGTVTPIGAP